MKKQIFIKNAPKPIAPYSQAILNERILFVSGQLAVDPFTGKLMEGDIKTQTRQIMENIGMILKEAGMDFSNVVKCSIFLSDMKIYGDVNEVYGEYFRSIPPAREAYQVAGLPMNANLEISCIAMHNS